MGRKGVRPGAAAVSTFTIAMATIGGRASMTAAANPVDSIRYE